VDYNRGASKGQANHQFVKYRLSNGYKSIKAEFPKRWEDEEGQAKNDKIIICNYLIYKYIEN